MCVCNFSWLGFCETRKVDVTNLKTFLMCSKSITYFVSNNIMHKYHVLLCCGVVIVAALSISFKVNSRALGPSYDCPGASELTLKNMGKWIAWIHPFRGPYSFIHMIYLEQDLRVSQGGTCNSLLAAGCSPTHIALCRMTLTTPGAVNRHQSDAISWALFWRHKRREIQQVLSDLVPDTLWFRFSLEC